jgi:hypothetical protein
MGDGLLHEVKFDGYPASYSTPEEAPFLIAALYGHP